MNCPQCQTANGPGSAFCGNCGAQMTVAQAAAPAGYPPPTGAGAPGGYNAPSGSGDWSAPSGTPGYDAPTGYNPAGGYSAGSPQQPGGFPQGQYQRGTSGSPLSSLPPTSFDLNRATTVDKVVAVASFIALISIWFPWFTVSISDGFASASASASATTAHGGWMYLEFIVALVLIAYLVARVAWERMPFNVPVAHDRILIIGTAVQLLIMLIAFFDVPSIPGISVSWAWGAFIGLLAALAAAGPVLYPSIRAFVDARRAS